MRRLLSLAPGLLVFLVQIVLISSARSPLAQDDESLLPPEAGSLPVELSADFVSYEHDRELYEADGNVRITQGTGRVLTTDWLALSTRTQIGVAVGNVRIQDGNEIIQAQFAYVDLQTLEATATDGSIDSTLGIFRGSRVQRISEQEYRVDEGSFSACHCPPETETLPWQVDVREAEVKVGGYAEAKGVTFRILNVPAFYIPWLIFPVKDERQTGLLIPTLGSGSRGGAKVDVPFFWAARENINVTLTPSYFSERGVKGKAQVEYVFGEHASGEIGGSLLPGDNQVEDEDDLIFSENRWAGWWKHQQPLGDHFRFGANVQHVSDNHYPLDFEDLDDVWSNARFLQSSIWTTGGARGLYGGVELMHFDDLNAPDDLDRDDFLLNRLPEVNMAMLPHGWRNLPVRAALDFDYIYFDQRKNPAGNSLSPGSPVVNGQFFDTGLDGRFNAEETLPPAPPPVPGDPHSDDGLSQGDGFFQEGEPLADYGHRFEIHPRLSMPLRLGLLENFGEVGYRATVYSPDRGDSETRGLFTARVDSRMRFIKALQVGNRSINHIVEPGVSFGVISDEDQDDNPLFIPNSGVRQRRLINKDLRGLLWNPADRVEQERLLLFSVANHFYAPPGNDQTAPRHIGSLRLGGGHDYERAESAYAYADATFTPSRNILVGASFGYDVEQSRSAESEVNFEWRTDPLHALESSVSDRRHSVAVGYRYLRDVPEFYEEWFRADDVFEEFEEEFERVNQFNLEGNLALLRQLDLFFSGFISVEESSTLGGTVGLAFLSECACWELIAQMRRRTRPDTTRFGIELRLAGLGFQNIERERPLIRSRLEDESADAP